LRDSEHQENLNWVMTQLEGIFTVIQLKDCQ